MKTTTPRLHLLGSFVLLVGTLLPASALAVTLTVTTTADSGGGSLRQALVAANASSADDTITFAIPASDPGCLDGVCTITLTTGELNVVERATGGALTITHPNPEEIRISGNNASRVLSNRGRLTLNGVTITGGKASENVGGGIYQLGEAMTLTNSIVTGNTANVGGGIYCSQTSMTISNTRLTGNVASGGAGFYTLRGNVVISNCVISNNTAVPPSPNSASEGGGITNDQGSVTIEDTTISGNSTVFDAGGVFNLAGSMTINRSTISGNMVSNTNPAVFTAGGGIVSAQSGNQSASLTMINSTISGNKAGRGGGGLFNQGRSSVLLLNCTVTGNETVSTNTTFGGGGGISVAFDNGSEVRSKNSLIAGNISGNGNGPDLATNGGPGFITLGNNLIGNTSGAMTTWAASDKINVAAQIEPLSANGGPTATHALQANSPAINMGNNCVFAANCSDLGTVPAVTTDQRGAPRAGTSANPVDIGAYELGAASPTPTPTPTPSPTPSPTATPVPTPTPTPVLWEAGRDLLRNEKPDNANEANAMNQTVRQWSYGSRAQAAGTAFTLFPPAIHQNAANGLEGWDSAGQAALSVNTKSVPVVLDNGSGPNKPIRPGQLYLRPSSGNAFTVARWTAPAPATYRILAKWIDIDNHGGNGASGHVVINGTEVFGRRVPADPVGPARFVGLEWDRGGNAAMAAEDFKLVAGDVVDFALGSRGDTSFDGTTFNALIRKVPTVTLPGVQPESITFEGADLVIPVQVEWDRPISKATLIMNGQPKTSDQSAPFELSVPNIASGTHYFSVVVRDDQGLQSVSDTFKVTVLKGGSAARSSASNGESDVTAAPNAGRTLYCTQSGLWSNPATWGGVGVPGRNDDAVIPAGFAVNVQSRTDVLNLEAVGSIVIGTPSSPNTLAVYGTFVASGEVSGATEQSQLIVFNRLSCLSGTAFFRDMSLLVSGETVISDRGGLRSANCVISTSGFTSIFGRAGTNRPILASVDRIDLNGRVTLGPTAQVVARILTNNASLIGNDSAGLVGNDGASLVGLDGSTLVGPDGGTFTSVKGLSLIGNDGGTLIGLDGGTLVAAGGGNRPIGSTDAAEPEALQETNPITLESGTVEGSLNFVGDVINRGAYISPGASPGTVTVSGNYTQDPNGTLVLEVGGTGTDPLQFDQLQIGGAANLGGHLVVRTINGFVPQAGDVLNPLTYGAVNGTFATVTSNAQVSFGPAGMTLQVNGANPPAPKALNISTRMRVEAGDNVLIAGFIVTGAQPKRVLIRGLGPSLPVSGPLADTVLELDGGAVVNDNWRSTQEAEIIATTIPPTSNLESAIVATLPTGGHTAILRGKNNGTGVGLVEVYDLESGQPEQLANISTRGKVQTGEDVMIGGFIVSGTYPAKILLRAIGPSLAQQGVSGTLQNPTLELVNAHGASLSNDDWRATQEAEIIATTVPPTADAESAIVATLVPGNYTAIVRGKDDTIGVALVEGFVLP